MAVVSSHIPIITLNVNGLSLPIESHRVAGWSIKQNPTIAPETQTQSEGVEITWQKTGVAILTSNNIDFKPKMVTRDKKGHHIMIKGSKHQEDITIINTIYPS